MSMDKECLMIDIHSIKKQRVLLKVDLSDALIRTEAVVKILPTVKLLLENGCGIYLMTSLGAALLTPAESCQILVDKVSNCIKRPVKWSPSCKKLSIQLGQVYLGENTFVNPGEVKADLLPIVNLLEAVDVVVFDTLKYLDANYASTQGLIKHPIPKAFGLNLLGLSKLQDELHSKKIGLVAGGQRIAWQLRLIRALAKQLSFLAVGGDLASAFIGKNGFSSGLLHDEIIRTLAILKKEKVKVLYPVDVVAYSAESQRNRICLYQDLDPEEIVYDLGTQSRSRILKCIDTTDIEMVVISGTIGYTLDPRYSRGTDILIKELIKREHTKVLIGKNVVKFASMLSVTEHYQYVIEGNTPEMTYLTNSLSLEALLHKYSAEENVGILE